MFSSGNAFSQRLKAGPQDLSFFSTVDETDQPYAIYIPKNFDEPRKYPLVVFLHGAWSNHRLGLRCAFGQGNFQDFIFFRESPDNVIAQGCFDNNWNLPAEAANAMKSTGVVNLK